MGHLLGLKHQDKVIMAPFRFNKDRCQLPVVNKQDGARITAATRDLKVREVSTKSTFHFFQIHIKTLFRNPGEVMALAKRSKAPLLPLALTQITTAALTPAILIFFTDEFWFAAINLHPAKIWSAAAAAILLASCYIPLSQDLLFPHREKRVITSNVAIVNLGIGLTIFLMVIGLFIVVCLAILLLEAWLFPADFIAHWFKDFNFTVGWREFIHVAVIVSTLGTLTGALGSGFMGRKIIRAISFSERDL